MSGSVLIPYVGFVVRNLMWQPSARPRDFLQSWKVLACGREIRPLRSSQIGVFQAKAKKKDEGKGVKGVFRGVMLGHRI